MIVVIVGFSVSFIFMDLVFIRLDYLTHTILTEIIDYDDLQIIVVLNNTSMERVFKRVA